MTDCVDVRRALLALAAVVAIVAAAPLSNLIARGSGGAALAAEAGDSGLDAGYVVAAADPLSAAERIGESAEAGRADPPDFFLEEIGLPEGARDARVDATGTVVGYVLDSACDDAAARLDADMQRRGWSSVPLGAVDGATYVKEDGRCRWALVTCTQVGDSTSVVFRCVAR